jgi:flagellar FliL protein
MTDQAATAEGEVDASHEGAGEGGAPSSGGKKKLIILIAAPVLLLLIVGAGLYFTGIIGGEKASEEKKEKEAAPKQTVFYDLPDILVNLNGNGKKGSFLKMTVSLELENQVDVAKLQSVMPRIIDNFQIYLRELRAEDLKGSAGMYRLREELLLRVNAAAAPAKVVDVLFKEMLVQ